MESKKRINPKQNGISESGGNKSSALNSGMIDSKQRTVNIQLQQADKQYDISKIHLACVWNLLTRLSVDIDEVEHHIRIGSLNSRLAQEQYNTLLIVHSEYPNILRQYSVLMKNLYGDDSLAIEMLCEADLMEQGNKIDLVKNEDELGQNSDIWDVDADQSNQQQQEGEQNQNEGQEGINQTEALNVPFAATEEMKIVSHSAYKMVQSSSDISIIVVAVCFVGATLIMIIGTNVPILFEISKIIKDRKAKIRVLCNITAEEAQKMYTLMQDRNDPNERKRIKRKKKKGDGNQTQRSGGTDETHSTASGASG
ncbi:MAG: hypothetical protein EZS28_025658, partial [Streblomastix strix]